MFTIQINYECLKAIQLKILAGAPAQLKYMLPHLQEYHFSILYKSGLKTVLADVLSHLCPIYEEIKFSVGIHHTRFGPDRKTALLDATRCDPVLCELMHTIIDGQPSGIDDILKLQHRFWKYHDNLTVKHGISLWYEA